MTIQTFHRAPGDSIDASEETDLQDAIEAETLALGTGNLRTEALNRYHFSPTIGAITNARRVSANIITAGTYSSSTYVPINHGTPMALDFGAGGLTIENGFVIRFQWSMLVTDFERAGNLGEYAFCLKTDTSGAGTFVQQSPDYWYSAMSYPRDGPSTATYWPMTNRRHTLSYTMVRPTPFTIYDARVDVKIENPWVVTIQETNFFAIIQRH